MGAEFLLGRLENVLATSTYVDVGAQLQETLRRRPA
jgi:hypothetical protein